MQINSILDSHIIVKGNDHQKEDLGNMEQSMGLRSESNAFGKRTACGVLRAIHVHGLSVRTVEHLSLSDVKLAVKSCGIFEVLHSDEAHAITRRLGDGVAIVDVRGVGSCTITGANHSISGPFTRTMADISPVEIVASFAPSIFAGLCGAAVGVVFSRAIIFEALGLVVGGFQASDVLLVISRLRSNHCRRNRVAKIARLGARLIVVLQAVGIAVTLVFAFILGDAIVFNDVMADDALVLLFLVGAVRLGGELSWFLQEHEFNFFYF